MDCFVAVARGPYHLYRSVLGEIIPNTGRYIEVEYIHIPLVDITCLHVIIVVYQGIFEGILFRLIRYDLRKKGVGTVAEVLERTAHIRQLPLCHKVDSEAFVIFGE